MYSPYHSWCSLPWQTWLDTFICTSELTQQCYQQKNNYYVIGISLLVKIQQQAEQYDLHKLQKCRKKDIKNRMKRNPFSCSGWGSGVLGGWVHSRLCFYLTIQNFLVLWNLTDTAKVFSNCDAVNIHQGVGRIWQDYISNSAAIWTNKT